MSMNNIIENLVVGSIVTGLIVFGIGGASSLLMTLFHIDLSLAIMWVMAGIIALCGIFSVGFLARILLGLYDEK